MLGTRTVVLLSVLTGIALELGVHALSGRREAWDSTEFWIMVAPSQVMTMMVRSGELGGLWPLTLILSSILSAPFVVASFAGSRLQRNAPPPA